MKLLLDTHVFLWSLLDPERLPDWISAALRAPGTELWLSPISLWETLLLAEKGRLELEPNGPSWLTKALEGVPFREAPLTNEVALRSRVVEVSHEDPADRFLAATAAVYGLTLVTADERLLAGTGYPVLKAE